MNGEAESYLSTLHALLLERFDREELIGICFHLKLSYDDLHGDGRIGKARELLLYIARRNKLSELLATLNRVRPDAEWPPVPQGFSRADQQSAEEIERFQNATRAPERPTTSPGANVPQFNISGEIRAGKVNIGGTEIVQGDQQINLDFSETNDDAGHSGERRTGS